MIKRTKITKIVLFTDTGYKISIPEEKLGLFFSASKINPKKPFQSLILPRLNKTDIFILLISAFLRKLNGIKPSIEEYSIISLIYGKIRFKKIIKLEVFLGGKKLLFDVSKIHLLNLLGDLRGVVYFNQYNLSEKSIRNKIVIDAGAHIGEFSLLCALLGAKKIYAFEPVSKTVEILRRNIKLNKFWEKIKVVPMALGDGEYSANISSKFIGDGAATIKRKYKQEGTEQIVITSLDFFVRKNKIKKIDFIKMDIEGFEENALNGAKETIKRDKPILYLSAYHKPEDKKLLPRLIKYIRADYQIKLLKKDEEDFYCC